MGDMLFFTYACVRCSLCKARHPNVKPQCRVCPDASTNTASPFTVDSGDGVCAHSVSTVVYKHSGQQVQSNSRTRTSAYFRSSRALRFARIARTQLPSTRCPVDDNLSAKTVYGNSVSKKMCMASRRINVRQETHHVHRCAFR